MKTDEQQIRELVSTWHAATKAGDVDKVLTLMTDDVVFLVHGRPPMGKAEFASVSRPPQGKPGLGRLGVHVEQALGRHDTARRRAVEARAA